MEDTAPRAVLLLEQCDDLREVLCEILSAHGYRVLAYPSLPPALHAPVRTLHAILVAVNGYFREPHDDLAELLESGGLPPAPVLALVSGDAPLRVPGVAVTLRKPVDEDRLCAALEGCCAAT
jgi:CheY-like chemotaxis protein